MLSGPTTTASTTSTILCGRWQFIYPAYPGTTQAEFNKIYHTTRNKSSVNAARFWYSDEIRLKDSGKALTALRLRRGPREMPVVAVGYNLDWNSVGYVAEGRRTTVSLTTDIPAFNNFSTHSRPWSGSNDSACLISQFQ